MGNQQAIERHPEETGDVAGLAKDMDILGRRRATILHSDNWWIIRG
jgi:hypothetical protein